MPNLGCWLIGGVNGKRRAVPLHPPPWLLPFRNLHHALHLSSRRMASCAWGA